MSPEEVFNLAVQNQRAGRLTDAEKFYRQMLGLRPDHAPSHNNLGSVLCLLARYEEAAGCFAAALALLPSNGEVQKNLTNVFFHLGATSMEKGQFEGAIEYFRRGIALRPEAALAHYNLGVSLEKLNRKAEAIGAYLKAIDADPKLAAAHNNLGGILQADGIADDAIKACRRAIELDPRLADAHNNLGNAYFHNGQMDEAMAAYRKAAELAPGRVDLAGNILFAPYYNPNCDFSTILTRYEYWNRRFGDLLEAAHVPHEKPAAGYVDRRLRIGYLSPNLRSHAEGAFILPLVENHDHQQFQIHCYFDALRGDAVTQRMKKGADVWLDTIGISDADLAARIRADGIDILVDLTMHMARGRPLVMARKPAPIQVAYLAYPGTTGMWSMDYRLTDSFVDPPGMFEGHYTEKCVRLPRTFACFDPAGMDKDNADRKADEIDPGPAPAVANGFVTFGCLNNFSKVNPAVIARWSGVLKLLPTSRLRLLAPEGSTRERVLAELAKLGVERGRVDFVSKQTRGEYLLEHRRIDVSLDTLPYCGHTTTLDSIWMGVPVVTRIGASAAGRVGWSVMNNLQLADLAADSDEHFAQIAVELATDLPRLSELRRTLRKRLLDSPIMDGAAFARDVEAAYRDMWKRWVAG